MENTDKLSASSLHLNAAKNIKLPYSFDPALDFDEQKNAIESKYRELLRVPDKLTNPVPLIEYRDDSNPEFDEIRFTFESEPNLFVPAHMLLPKNIKGSLPVVICLQGHSTGMHISLGRVKYSGDENSISGGDRDFAIQAVRRGYASIAMEQRGFGEMKTEIAPKAGCNHVAMQALMLGRTLIGERTLDVMQLIDTLTAFDYLDLNRIGLMGNSGGGTATYHASCLEKRIKVTMPSCSFNTYYDSIMSMHHCTCNYIPDILKYMEMPDLAIMIAPRPLIIVNGKDDTIFPLHAVENGFETVKRIYAAAGVPDNCKLIIGDGGHRFYADDSWPVFEKFCI